MPWRIPLVFAVSFFVHYLDRNIISVALPAIGASAGWSDQQLAAHGEWLLGAFFLVYGAAQMLLAGPAERWGRKRSLLLVVLGFSLVTMAMGTVSLWAAGAGLVAGLVALRALLGLAESVHVPMMSAITAQHFPAAVRARANSTWSVGLIVATALGPLIVVPVVATHGWQAAFLLIGAAGLLVALPLLWWGVPRDAAAAPADEASSAWPFARNPDYWLYVLCGVLNAFCAFGILGWLPTYFVRAKGLDFAALGWPLAIVFSTGVVATLAWSWWGDRRQRRLPAVVVGFAAASALCAAAIAQTALVPLVLLFALAVAGQSAFTAQEYATVQGLAGDRNVGGATGLYNGISLIVGGVGGSLVPGSIVAATGDFNRGLMAVSIGAALAAVASLALAIRTRR
jgi:sugar phosphate permease